MMTKKEMSQIAEWHGYQLTIQQVRNKRQGQTMDAVHIHWEGEFFSQFVDWFADMEHLPMKELVERFARVKRQVKEIAAEADLLSQR